MRADRYNKQVDDIIKSYFPDKKAKWTWSSASEARIYIAKVTQMQKELRLVKKSVTATMRTINSNFQSDRVQVGKSFGNALLGGLFGRKTMGKVNASHRDAIRQQQISVRAPYERVNRRIDASILYLDEVKLSIESWIVRKGK